MILTHFCIQRCKFCGSSVTKSTPKPSIDHVKMLVGLWHNSTSTHHRGSTARTARDPLKAIVRAVRAWPWPGHEIRIPWGIRDLIETLLKTPQDLWGKSYGLWIPVRISLIYLIFGRGRPSYKWYIYIYRNFVVTMSLLNKAFSNRPPKRQVVQFEVFILYCKSFEVPIHFIRPSSLCFWGFL